MKTTYFSWLGCLEYAQALDLQMQVCGMKRRGFAEDILLLLEHPPTITLGRNGKWHHLIASEEVLSARGVTCYDVDRGGDITFHGPGQLVGYPILQLEASERDVRGYMRNLEQSLIQALAAYGILGRRDDEHTGVWTTKGKIAALGVHISRWITRHGFALNVNTDMSFYDLIVPCGIVGKGVTSMRSFTNYPVGLEEVAERYAAVFGTVFGRRMIRVSEPVLRETLRHFDHESTVA